MSEPLDVREFFDRRSPAYSTVSRWALDERLNIMTDQLIRGFSGELAVDLGAGTGILISRVENFSLRLAVDISEGMLRQIISNDVQRLVADLHNLPLKDHSADLVICRQVLHYCRLDEALRSIRRILSTNGILHIVQVIEVDNVPASWDAEWAGFRNVRDRKHLRRADLEKSCSAAGLRVTSYDATRVRDSYSWDQFLLKNNVNANDENRVRQFFECAPPPVSEAINLHVDEQGIAYDREFGLWLLQSDV
jgi:ubiquinone/menaquinone biosynthesis C-methylase UbiE